MQIIVKVIDHSFQRYETIGDWWFESDGTLQIRVSNLGDERYHFLISFHEQAEAILCKARGISEEEVSNFDKRFEQNRPEGNTDEPGDHPNAPYKAEHFFATSIERLMAAELGVEWEDYDAAVQSL